MLLKRQTSAMILGLFLSLSCTLTAQRLTTQARIKCTLKGDACECRVENHKEILGELAKSKRNILPPHYAVLWEFDDGTYTIERGQKVVKHTYNLAKNYVIKASFIVQYSDYAIPSTTRDIKILKEGPAVSTPSVFQLLAGLPAEAKKEMRGNDEMTIVADFPKEGDMTLDYDADMLLSGQPLRAHLGARIVSNAGNKVTIHADKAQRLFIYFKTKTFVTTKANHNQETTVTGNFEGKTSVLKFQKVDALDPNRLTVKPRKLRYSTFEKNKDMPFVYRLEFENEGAENAQKVRMTIDLPNGLRLEPDNIKNWTYRCGALEQKECPVFFNKLPTGKASETPYLFIDLSNQIKEKKVEMTFFNVDLKGNEYPDKEMRRGEVNYELIPHKRLPNRRLVSDANIFFKDNPTPTPASAKTRFSLEPRLGVRGSYQLPLKKSEKAIYGLSLFLSNYRPDRVYFPFEIGIAVNERELDSLGNLLKYRPMHLAVQARKNWGNLFAYGIGVSANFATNVRSHKPNFTLFDKGFAYSNFQIFGDIGVLNTRKGGLGFGARGGVPFNLNEKLTIPTTFNAQFYMQYKF